MTCSHIVECLRKNNIEPEAFASSEYSNEYKVSNALVYDKTTQFYSKQENKPQFWGVYFKQPVSIKGYEITTNPVNENFVSIYNWTFSLSFDNKTWSVVHGPVESTLTEKLYYFNQHYNALYARIDGNSLILGIKPE